MAKKTNNINVILGCPEEEVLVAISLIQKFKRKNKLDFNLTIVLDFSIEDRGVYFYNTDGKKKHIHADKVFINPLLCDDIDDDVDFCHGHTKDLTTFGVLLHEFAHMLSLSLFSITKDYIKQFPNERLYLNDYSNNCLNDEVAELVALYLTNPYLLKLISKKHFQFVNQYFKSPIANSSKQCFTLYTDFPIKCKNYLIERWGIVYNYDLNKFEIIPSVK